MCREDKTGDKYLKEVSVEEVLDILKKEDAPVRRGGTPDPKKAKVDIGKPDKPGSYQVVAQRSQKF